MGYFSDHKQTIFILVDAGFVSWQYLEFELRDINLGRHIKIITVNQLQVKHIEALSD